MIVPSVGRIVWFYPAADDLMLWAKSQPCAAVVAFALSDRLVNLSVFDMSGEQHARLHVPLVQEGDDPRPAGESYCTWMPYQVQAAARHAAGPGEAFADSVAARIVVA